LAIRVLLPPSVGRIRERVNRKIFMSRKAAKTQRFFVEKVKAKEAKKRFYIFLKYNFLK